MDRLQAATYERGWRDFDRGGSHAMRRRIMARLVDDHPDALALWEAGWSDNQHARGFGATRETTWQETLASE